MEITFTDEASPITYVRDEAGQLVVYAALSVPGVLPYPGYKVGRPDLKEAKLLVLPETLKDNAVTQSIIGKPVTKHHPSGLLGAHNVSKHTRGSVSGISFVDDGQGEIIPKIKMVVFNDELARNIESGDLSQFSAGYTGKIDWTPGVHPKYGSYHGIQVREAYNHGAICEKSRSGKIVLMTDSMEEVMEPTMEDFVKALEAFKTDILKDLAVLQGNVAGLAQTFNDSREETEKPDVDALVEAAVKQQLTIRVGLHERARRLGVTTLNFDDSTDNLCDKICKHLNYTTSNPEVLLAFMDGVEQAAKKPTPATRGEESIPLNVGTKKVPKLSLTPRK
jgi:hypothetical protein